MADATPSVNVRQRIWTDKNTAMRTSRVTQVKSMFVADSEKENVVQRTATKTGDVATPVKPVARQLFEKQAMAARTPLQVKTNVNNTPLQTQKPKTVQRKTPDVSKTPFTKTPFSKLQFTKTPFAKLPVPKSTTPLTKSETPVTKQQESVHVQESSVNDVADVEYCPPSVIPLVDDTDVMDIKAVDRLIQGLNENGLPFRVPLSAPSPPPVIDDGPLLPVIEEKGDTAISTSWFDPLPEEPICF